MHHLRFIFILLLGPSLALAQNIGGKDSDLLEKGGFIQSKNLDNPFAKNEKAKRILLNEVIEQGLRKNYDQSLRNYESSKLDIEFKGTSDSFWVPTFKLELSTDPFRAGQIYNGGKNQNERLRAPVGEFALKMEDYTVFNWGKDFLQFQIEKSTYERNKNKLKENTRELRHHLIAQYFRLYTVKEIEKVYREQLQKASFVYRLNREKVVLKKISKQDYYQSRTEYLRAQTEFFEAQKNSQIEDERLSRMISDEGNNLYLPGEILLFKEIQMPIDEAINLSLEQNPEVLDSKTKILNTKRSYDINLKDNLPLPKLSLNVGSYSYGIGNDRSGFNRETYPGNSDVELVATLTATWTITGKDGLFNTRKTRTGLIDHHMALEEFQRAKFYSTSSIQESFTELTNLQTQVKVLQVRSENIIKTFDMVLDNYIAKRTNFSEFQWALKELVNGRIELLLTKFKHLEVKLKLSDIIGIEDFPGENFEGLAIKREFE